MRDIGILTVQTVSADSLVELVDAYARRNGTRATHNEGESVLGRPPNAIYVRNLIPQNNAYYSGQERAEIEQKLGSSLKGYVSIHFTSTNSAYELANALATEVRGLWGGILDYSGAGGEVGTPPAGKG